MKTRTRLNVILLSITFLILLSGIIIPLTPVVHADQGLTIDAGSLNGSYAGVAVEGTGNVFVTGSSLLLGQWPTMGVLLTYTPSGTLRQLATSSYPQTVVAPQDSFGAGVAVDTSQNIYFAGTSKATGAAQGEFFNGYLVKYNPSYSIDWQTTWGGSISDAVPRAVATDAVDNVYVAGNTNGYWSGNGDTIAGLSRVFLVKYQGSEGVLTFQGTWGGESNNDYANALAVDNLGNVYIVGTTYTYGQLGHGSVFLLKWDLTGDFENGEISYLKTWGGYNQTDYGYGVALDPEGNVYVTGTTYSYGLNPGLPSAFLLKYNSNGQLLNQEIWGGTSADYGYGVATDNLGNVYMAGTTYSYSMTSGHPNVFLVKYDPSGNIVYQKTWGGAEADYGYAVAVDQLGNAYVTGYTYSFGPNPQRTGEQSTTYQNLAALFLLKYDSNGNLWWQRIWSGTPLNQ
ncbi:MAG TPA: SBBP repeat-containing protein [Candidatus Bathyarchaeia archaeon]|nr:SBBP repeat-containing protein [Candidatus Bathyarchaeia archaeon]